MKAKDINRWVARTLEECARLKEDWGGENEAPITVEAIRDAKRLLEMLIRHRDGIAPTILNLGPGPNGEMLACLSFSHGDEDANWAELWLNGDQTIECLFDHPVVGDDAYPRMTFEDFEVWLKRRARRPRPTRDRRIRVAQ